MEFPFDVNVWTPIIMTATKLSRLVIFALLPVLAGCSVFHKQKEPAPCPRVSLLGDASQLTHFRDGPGRDVTDIDLSAQFVGYKGYCEYDDKTNIMKLTLQVEINAERGPAAQSRSLPLAYFIAIPAFYPDPHAKQVLPVQLDFPDNTNRVHYVDNKVELSFPLTDFQNLARYEVFLGLQLDQDELDYNRRNKPAL